MSECPDSPTLRSTITHLDRQLELQQTQRTAEQHEAAATIDRLERLLAKVSPSKRTWHMEDAEELSRLRATVARQAKELKSTHENSGEMEEAVRAMAKAQGDQRRLYRDRQQLMASSVLSRSLRQHTMNAVRWIVIRWSIAVITAEAEDQTGENIQRLNRKLVSERMGRRWRLDDEPIEPIPRASPSLFSNCAAAGHPAEVETEGEMMMLLQHNMQAHKGALEQQSATHAHECKQLAHSSALLSGATALVVARHHLVTRGLICIVSQWARHTAAAATEAARRQVSHHQHSELQQSLTQQDSNSTLQNEISVHETEIELLKQQIESLRDTEAELGAARTLAAETDQLVAFFTQREAARQLCKHCCFVGPGGQPSIVSPPPSSSDKPSLLGRATFGMFGAAGKK